jgi:hypothetical protein
MAGKVNDKAGVGTAAGVVVGFFSVVSQEE